MRSCAKLESADAGGPTIGIHLHKHLDREARMVQGYPAFTYVEAAARSKKNGISRDIRLDLNVMKSIRRGTSGGATLVQHGARDKIDNYEHIRIASHLAENIGIASAGRRMRRTRFTCLHAIHIHVDRIRRPGHAFASIEGFVECIQR